MVQQGNQKKFVGSLKEVNEILIGGLHKACKTYLRSSQEINQRLLRSSSEVCKKFTKLFVSSQKDCKTFLRRL
jgi:hypothetical protein